MIESTVVDPAEPGSLDVTDLRELVRLGERFEAAWRQEAAPPSVELYLIGVPDSRRAVTERHLRSLAAELSGGPAAEAIPAVPDRYLLGKRIGHGGMGMIYQALDRESGTTVALKWIRSEWLDSLGDEQRKEMVARFVREGRVAAKVQHPNIVAIHDIGECGGIPYYTMTWIEGVTLRDRLTGGPLRPHDAVAILLPIARAVAEAHAVGVIHRDIKPRNIFLDHRDQPHLGDFGLAKAIGIEDHTELTQSGMLLGTAPYMSPEQVQNSRRVGPLSDVYSLGATLYQAITGRPPFQSPEVAVVYQQVIQVNPASPRQLNPELPRDIDWVVMKCLAKAPADRYASAAALADDLQRFANKQPVLARPPGPALRLLRWTQRAPWKAGVVLLILFMIVAAGASTAGWVEQSRQQAARQVVLALGTAQPAEIRPLLEQLEAHRQRALPLLREALGRSAPGSVPRFNLMLGRARLGSVTDELMGFLLTGSADQVEAFVEGIRLPPAETRRFHASLVAPDRPGRESLRAAAVLARFDPKAIAWTPALSRRVALPLLDEPVTTLTVWAALLGRLAPDLGDPLHAVLRDKVISESRRSSAALLLSQWYARPGDASRLPEAIADADGAQVSSLAQALGQHPEVALDLIQRSRATADPLDHRARWIAALMLANQPETAWSMLRHSADDNLRTELLFHLATWQIPPQMLLDRLGREPDVSVRRALILTLAQYPMAMMPAEVLEKAVVQVGQAYATDPDPGIHSAARWALGIAWSRPLPEAARPPGARWFIADGQSMVVVTTGPTAPYAIGVTEVTRRDFYRHCPDIRKRWEHRNTLPDDQPINYVSYHEALEFCEKMTEAVGKRWKVRPPTRTEWEEAAGAGARTLRPHGDRLEHLNHFAWSSGNSGDRIHPVAHLMPNDFGTFDMLGNLEEWAIPDRFTPPMDISTTRGYTYDTAIENFQMNELGVSTKTFMSGDPRVGLRVVCELTTKDLEELAIAP